MEVTSSKIQKSLDDTLIEKLLKLSSICPSCADELASWISLGHIMEKVYSHYLNKIDVTAIPNQLKIVYISYDWNDTEHENMKLEVLNLETMTKHQIELGDGHKEPIYLTDTYIVMENDALIINLNTYEQISLKEDFFVDENLNSLYKIYLSPDEKYVISNILIDYDQSYLIEIRSFETKQLIDSFSLIDEFIFNPKFYINYYNYAIEENRENWYIYSKYNIYQIRFHTRDFNTSSIE